MSENIKKPVTIGKIAKSTPAIIQLEALECGAASLDMILGYYEKWIPLEEVRYACDVSRNGASAENILKAARNYGLDAGAYRYSLDGIKNKATFPCIIHWNFNHYVVLKGFKKDKVYINDPAKGAVVISFEAFTKSFTGIALQFEPTEEFKKEGHRITPFEQVRNKLKDYRAAVVFVTLVTLISSVFTLFSTGLDRLFLDKILTRYYKDMSFFFKALLAVQFMQIVFKFFYDSTMLAFNGKLAVVGSTSFMWKVLHMPMRFFSQRSASDIQGRQSQNENIAKSLVYTVGPLALNVVMMVFYLIVMLRYNVVLSIIGVSAIAINFAMSFFITNKKRERQKVQQKEDSTLATATLAGIDTVESLKASGAIDSYFAKWAGYQASAVKEKTDIYRLNYIFGGLPNLMLKLSDIIILICGGYLMLVGEFTMGMVLAFQSYLDAFTKPTSSIITAGEKMQELSIQIERVDDVLNYPDDENVVNRDFPEQESKKLSGYIEIKNISFAYSRLSDAVIKDFSMTLEPGKSVAFVGSSGCGKSTLSKLITGLYNPSSGTITYDGKTIKEIDRNIFTGSIGVVDQDLILFDDTVANNLKFWDESIDDETIVRAAKDAQAHDDIMLKEGGYQHRIVSGGAEFSGGQKQRLEIARVLAQDPSIIIMDEATSALDAKTEYEVVKAIKARGITSIIVAHRLSTIRSCDEIIVLDHGEIVERGTHEELYAKDGLYKELVISE